MTTTILDFLPHYPTLEEDDSIYTKKEYKAERKKLMSKYEKGGIIN